MPFNEPRWGGNEPDDKKKKARDDAHYDDDREDARKSEEMQSIEDMWEKVDALFGGRGRKKKPQLKGRDDFSRYDEEPELELDIDKKSNENVSWSMDVSVNTESMKPFFNKQAFNLLIWGLGALGALWASSSFYIVPEGQEGVVTTFGKYTTTTQPGFHWHLPTPIQDVRLVDVSRVRTTEIGAPGRPERLKEALMLTDDENIVDLQFTVQYRIRPGQAQYYVYNLRTPEETVQQVAESAMREVVGRKTMDSVLFESKAEIAEAVRRTMQQTLDHYKSGIEIMSVAIQNAQPPEPVQAAFNDAVKAGQDRERAINLGEAYRNAVLPKAQGAADRLREEAHGYAARVTEAANGEAQRFRDLVVQYKAQPQVTRDRLYVDTMQDIYQKTAKVYVDAKGSNPLLYVPLDKIVGNVKREAKSLDPEDFKPEGTHVDVDKPQVPSPRPTERLRSDLRRTSN